MPACKNVLGIFKIYLENGNIYVENGNNSVTNFNKTKNNSVENLKIERNYDCVCSKEGLYTVCYYYYDNIKYTYIVLLKNICVSRAKIIINDLLLLAQLDLLYEQHGQFLLEHREHCQYIDKENQTCKEWSTLATTESIIKKVCKHHKEENIFYTIRQQQRIRKPKQKSSVIFNKNIFKNIEKYNKNNKRKIL